LIKSTLYISFDGLSDPLGQSQILPYVTGIAASGYSITILSCEKKERLEKEKERIQQLLGTYSISWRYILYDEGGSFLSRYNYVKKLAKMAEQEQAEKKFSLVHCRSYLASLVGLGLKRRHGVKFIFDMRGFWANERLDGGIWSKSNPLHFIFYRYFKSREKQFLSESDAIVSLTSSALAWLEKKLPGVKNKSSVIPCCVNTNTFNPSSVKPASLNGINADDHVIVYAGSIGTWYYTREMIDCMLVWKEKIPELKLLIITRDTQQLGEVLSAYTPGQRKFISTVSASYSEMPSWLALAKASVFFIKPAFSKIASSPTKMAECWAMDLPIITNGGIGDNDFYFSEKKGGILIHSFTKDEYKSACEKYLSLNNSPGHYRDIALKDFDTARAVQTYASIYQRLTGDRT
jgi:glycosyltransferase involved in cell wall biosynthesis